MAPPHSPNGKRPPAKVTYGKQDAKSESSSQDQYDQMADLGPQRIKNLPLSDGPKYPLLLRPCTSVMRVPTPKCANPRKIDSAWSALVLETKDVDCPDGLGTGDSYRDGPNFRPSRLLHAQKHLQQQNLNQSSTTQLSLPKKPPTQIRITPDVLGERPTTLPVPRPRISPSFVTRVVRQRISQASLDVSSTRGKIASGPNPNTAQHVSQRSLPVKHNLQQPRFNSWNTGRLAVASEIAYDYQTARRLVHNHIQDNAVQLPDKSLGKDRLAHDGLAQDEPVPKNLTINSPDDSKAESTNESAPYKLPSSWANNQRSTASKIATTSPLTNGKQVITNEEKPKLTASNAWQEAITVVNSSGATTPAKPIVTSLSYSKYAIDANEIPYPQVTTMKSSKEVIACPPLFRNASNKNISVTHGIATDFPKTSAIGLSQSKYAITPKNTMTAVPSSINAHLAPLSHRTLTAVETQSTYAFGELSENTDSRAVQGVINAHAITHSGSKDLIVAPSHEETIPAQQVVTQSTALHAHTENNKSIQSPHSCQSISAEHVPIISEEEDVGFMAPDNTQERPHGIVEDLLDISESSTITYPNLRPLSIVSGTGSEYPSSPTCSSPSRPKYNSMCLVSSPLEHTATTTEMIPLQPTISISQRKLIERYEKQAILLERRRAWEEAEVKYKEIQQELKLLDEEDMVSEEVDLS